ncbi:MAG TPA: 5-formyltetrahydrofolate cyclo-ligase [Cellvibrionaceae bacterium]
MFTSPSKQLLRRQLRAYRRSLSPAQQRRAALGLAQAFLRLSPLNKANTIALYIAGDGEINPNLLVRRLVALGKQIYLPRLNTQGNSMVFARYQIGDQLKPSCLGVLQPLPSAPQLAAQALDIVALPLVGFDRYGNRLGMGGGFYDRRFDFDCAHRPFLVGLAHEGQEVEMLPVEPWDIPLNWIATDQRLIRCPRVRRLKG